MTSIPGDTLSVGNGLLVGFTKARNFWVHLNRAGLIPSIHEDAEPASVSPRNPFDGFYNVNFGNTMLPVAGGMIGFNNLRLESIPQTMFLRASQILAIDKKMDDGKPTTGRVLIANNTACYDSTTLSYIISDTGCRIFINIFH